MFLFFSIVNTLHVTLRRTRLHCHGDGSAHRFRLFGMENQYRAVVVTFTRHCKIITKISSHFFEEDNIVIHVYL